jgi:phospholipid/cholesterol/gamma-HCH transport system ATP-binding protein
MPEAKKEVVIRVTGLVVGFGKTNVLDHIALDVYRGEILGFVGSKPATGAGAHHHRVAAEARRQDRGFWG